MKSILAFAITLALAAAGPAVAGMQGQGAKPDAKKPEYKEPNPGPYRLRQQQDFKALDKNGDGCISKQEYGAQ
jgi:hypothetical protein